MFVNLLSNAIKYTRPRELAIIEVGKNTVDGRPAIFVRDNRWTIARPAPEHRACLNDFAKTRVR